MTPPPDVPNTAGESERITQLQQALATTQQERDDALDLIRKLYIRQAIQPASQSQWVERWLKERGISWRQG